MDNPGLTEYLQNRGYADYCFCGRLRMCDVERSGGYALMHRRPTLHFPIDVLSGEPFFLIPKSVATKHDERGVTYALLSDRKLFGEIYRYVLPDYCDAMPQNSGVLIGSFIPSAKVVSGLTFPGDIDVLVIPYEGDDLVLSCTLAIEIKVIRASFARQGKSPNQFGFSQASGLLAAGFPYVTVGHLIVSDQSPEDVWREVGMAKVIDGASGACELLPSTMHDMLPADLLKRSHGRLKSNCPDPLLGHFSAYLGGDGMWFPEGKPAAFNPHTSARVLDGIYAYYQENYQYFLRTHCYTSSVPITVSESDRRERWRLMVKKMHRDFPNTIKAD